MQLNNNRNFKYNNNKNNRKYNYTNKYCDDCRMRGHTTSECTNNVQCIHCGRFGHYTKDCYNQKPSYSHETPNKYNNKRYLNRKNTKNDKQNMRECSICGQSTHYASQCRNNNSLNVNIENKSNNKTKKRKISNKNIPSNANIIRNNRKNDQNIIPQKNTQYNDSNDYDFQNDSLFETIDIDLNTNIIADEYYDINDIIDENCYPNEFTDHPMFNSIPSVNKERYFMKKDRDKTKADVKAAKDNCA